LPKVDEVASRGDLRAAIRAFRQATYLSAHLAIASRRAFERPGWAMLNGDGNEDLAGFGATPAATWRTIASKLTATAS
jgi:hypothetical protein